ncbi:putative F-box protein At1g65770 [Arachis stenosperma]|uniref:putative F-box protein At1g65770 n=1 Tax=Arachis stenosperma TaxID=217475 RepID=UPI0025AB89DE|nr:putative F-box protein At1g65770 [Arachis stenosperma]
MGEVDQWENIHEDMLNQIAKRLYSYDDYLQLPLVCKQWNSKLPKIPNGIKAPWLLVPIGGAAKEPFKAGKDICHVSQLPTIDEETVDTFSVEEKGIYHLKLELQYNLIRGSCHGWLIIVSIYEGTIRMLNPLTKVCLDLPPISTLPNVNDDGDECSYYLGPLKYITDIVYAYKIIVWKVVINSAPINDNNNNFMAVALYGAATHLAFYKSNSRKWIKLTTNDDPYTYFQDVIFFQEKIYIIDDNGQLYEFDTNTKAEPVRITHEVTPPSDVVTQEEVTNLKYLIGCADGSLLMVVRHVHNLMQQDNQRSYETIKFDIYELKKNANTWSRITSLGNYVLVIGFNGSVQMLADDFSNCKGNQIFFTDNFVDDQTLDDVVYYHNIGIFNLEDESCQTVLSDVNFFCPPVWILL